MHSKGPPSHHHWWLIRGSNWFPVSTSLAWANRQTNTRLASIPDSHSPAFYYRTVKQLGSGVWERGYARLGTRLCETGNEATRDWERGYARLGTRLRETGNEAMRDWERGYARLGTRLRETGNEATWDWEWGYQIHVACAENVSCTLNGILDKAGRCDYNFTLE